MTKKPQVHTKLLSPIEFGENIITNDRKYKLLWDYVKRNVTTKYLTTTITCILYDCAKCHTYGEQTYIHKANR